MSRFWNFLFDRRTLAVIGFAALAAFIFIGADTLEIALFWAAIALGAALTLWLLVWIVRKIRARRAARALEKAIDDQTLQAAQAAPPEKRDDMTALRTRLMEAVKTIRTSKLGQLTGSAALYELPWYMVIGNPAAGKSTAVIKSGLQFPFADAAGSIIQGIGGTRNCDWFFTNQGVLLDTAGRYAVHEEDRQEWLGFLSLLKKYRPKAPINGIIIAASVAELSGGRTENAIQLAKNLRQRVQELTEKLGVFAPVYLVFTKADLIAGFAEFFEDRDRAERERTWGATLPYNQSDRATERADALAQFDERFDELYEGLKEMSLARMSLQRGQALPPGVLTFPIEFAGLKAPLRAFVATLFEDNPYQNRPIFRGFYFTSAVQEGVSSSRASERVAQQFALAAGAAPRTTAVVVADKGFFLTDLFSKVIFADRDLVRQYASKATLRLRAWAFGAGVVALALVLGSWTYSYFGNRQLMANVQADLDKAVKLQDGRSDLASRLEALETLQDRIEMFERYRERKPLGIGLGLYQGAPIEDKLRQEYWNGVRQVMLEPVAQAIEAYLTDVNANPARLKPMLRTPESGAAPQREESQRRAAGQRFVDASPEDSGDAYNALKTYLMLADRQHLEASHLTDQITRFWRNWLDNNRGAMPREQMMRSAERMISFTTTHLNDPAYPLVTNKLAMVDSTREHLRELVRGMRGVERVYADVKARAATRFPPVTVAGLVDDQDKDIAAGSYAVPGTFTREAWEGFVEKAFKDAATKELQSADWVLKTAARDDLTLEGSPEQIRKQLTELYKTEFVREWQRFMQGVTINGFGSFEVAVARMNRLGDTQQSPIRRIMNKLYDQTSWDNPTLLNDQMGRAQGGVIAWFKQTVLRQAPSRVDVNINLQTDKAAIALGPIGREFSPLARLMTARDDSPTLLVGYLQTLSKVRTKFNQIRNQGDPGPGSRAMLVTTVEGSSSELAESLRFVDEQMLVGMTDTARASLRPLLVRPLMEAAIVVVPQAETEINRIWNAQVYEPFQRTLASKYPFDGASRVEAAPGEIAKIFGPDGAIAKFSGDTLGPLVTRRGDTIEPRSWGSVGIRLWPEFTSGFASWVGVLDAASGGGGGGGGGGGNSGGGGGSAGGAAAVSGDQVVFEIMPMGAPGLSEYTLVIDSQTLRYRNTAADWVRMVWPNHAGVLGARLTAVTNEGRSIEFVNEPGKAGVERLLGAGARRKLPGNINEMTWTSGQYKLQLQLRVLQQPGEAPSASSGGGGGGGSSGGGAAVVGSARLRGTRLPTLVAGIDPARAAAQAAMAPATGTGAASLVQPATGAALPAARGAPGAQR